VIELRFPPVNEIVVVWDGSLASKFNLMKAKTYHPNKLIVYAMSYFSSDPDVDIVIADYGQNPATNKYKNLERFIKKNFEPRKVLVLLPYSWEDVEKFREITRTINDIWFGDFAKSYNVDDLLVFVAKSQ